MRAVDLLYISYQNFRNRKSRSFLTILGVSVGIGAILFLVSLGYGLQNMLLEKITTKESLLTLDIVPSEAQVVAITKDTLEKIKQIPGTEKISPQANFPSQLSVDELSSEANLNTVDSSFFSLAGTTPQMGRFFESGDYLKAIVNSPTAQLFSSSPEEMIGKKVKLMVFITENKDGVDVIVPFPMDKEFEVIGILDDSGTSPEVYIKSEDALELPIQQYQAAKVKVADDTMLEPAREQLINMGFIVSALSDTISQANKIFAAVQIVLAVFGVIALVVAAIGLVNTMTIALLERTNEIGIMRAIGGAPRDVSRLFLGESLIIGFLGGVGGIICGLAACKIFNLALNFLAKNLGGQPVDLFYSPTWFMLFIMALSTVVGFLGGLWPARRAAKLHPLDALRYK